MKADPANPLTIVSAAECISFRRERRKICGDGHEHIRMIADMTHGLFGRSPDHFASSMTAMAIDAAVFNYPASDHYVAYAVLPPQAARDSTFYQRQNLPGPSGGRIWVPSKRNRASADVPYKEEAENEPCRLRSRNAAPF